MTKLPPGWRVKNSKGDFAGPPPLPEDHQNGASGDEGSENGHDVIGEEAGLDIRPDSPGWEDMEVDTEDVSVQCLLCPQQFSSPQLMLEHCRDKHSFDFVQTVRSRALDFYKTIKYVNLIRSRVRHGVADPTHLDGASLDPDGLLKPAMEEDALLFSLDEVIDLDASTEQDGPQDAASVDGAP